jgi:hypothetical protein
LLVQIFFFTLIALISVNKTLAADGIYRRDFRFDGPGHLEYPNQQSGFGGKNKADGQKNQFQIEEVSD